MLKKQFFKKAALVAVGVMLMSESVMATTNWIITANQNTYKDSSTSDTKTNKNNYAIVHRTQGTSTDLQRSPLVMYVQGTNGYENYKSEYVMMTYPVTSVQAYYNNWTTDYRNKQFKTSVKLSATSYYSSVNVYGDTTA